MKLNLHKYLNLFVYSLYIVTFICMDMSVSVETLPDQFSVCEVVVYGNQLHRVQQVLNTHLGFKSYQVKNVTTGELFDVGKHLLSKPFVEDILLANIDWDADVKESDVIHGELADVVELEEIKPVPRHAVLTEMEIDGIAQARLSENSEKQTKWAVSLFKGK